MVGKESTIISRAAVDKIVHPRLISERVRTRPMISRGSERCHPFSRLLSGFPLSVRTWVRIEIDDVVSLDIQATLQSIQCTEVEQYRLSLFLIYFDDAYAASGSIRGLAGFRKIKDNEPNSDKVNPTLWIYYSDHRISACVNSSLDAQRCRLLLFKNTEETEISVRTSSATFICKDAIVRLFGRK